jgi:hypothetical protein
MRPMLVHMERVPLTAEWRERIARHQAELEDRIRRCDLPLIGLAAPGPGPGMVGSTDGAGETINSVGLSYGDPIRHDGPRVDVHTARDQTDVRALLADALDHAGDESPLPDRSERVDLVIDGAPVPAVLLRAGARFWAARCRYRDCEIVVVARDWALDAAGLASVPDVEPFLRARAAYIAALRDDPPTPPDPLAPLVVDDPHRALVDALLAVTEAVSRDRVHQPRRREFRQARRSIPGLWETTVSAQARLTGGSRDDANDVVTTMVNQLTSLQEQASWFTAEPRLREAAISETIAYWTGSDRSVPSRPAQEAWQRHWSGRRGWPPEVLSADDMSTRRAWFERLRSGQEAWLDAWAGWVRDRLPPE